MKDIRSALWHLRSGGIPQVRDWQLRRRAEAGFLVFENAKGAQGGWYGKRKNKRLAFAPFASPEVGPRRPDLRVAVILDDFSMRAFSYEWELVPIQKNSWKEDLPASGVDMVFIESAWNGNGGSWRYQLTGSNGPTAAVVEMLAWCRDQRIPTVFWNKEDPPHFSDFLPLARLVDYVLTSDANKIPDYRTELGHDRIGTLPFAAQPAIHNPIRPRHGYQSRGVAFAGMYFAHKYPERRDQLGALLQGAIDAETKSELKLEIFSRQLGADAKYQFPAPFDHSVVGSLSYEQMLTAYRAYRIFLNVNSVVDSPSMCARRIFEITASGTPVVSAPSVAIPNFFSDDEVFLATTSGQTTDVINALAINPELGERAVHRAQRKIWSAHTYAHRAETVVSMALPRESVAVELPSVSALVSSIRPHQLEHVFASVGSQTDVDIELVLLTHGFQPKRREIDRLQDQYGVASLVVLTAEQDKTLGECLNECVAASAGEVLSKMDDDDIYCSDYMSDMLHALNFSRAEVVGKQAHYMYVEQFDATILRYPHMEHRFSGMVMGPTLTGRRDVFLSHRFEEVSRGEDTAFLKSIVSGDGAIYSTDRYNYCQVRHGSGHTWNITDAELLASGAIKFFGRPEGHIKL